MPELLNAKTNNCQNDELPWKPQINIFCIQIWFDTKFVVVAQVIIKVMAQVIIKGRTSYLCYNGYIYIKHSSSAANKYWRCKFHRECSARLTSTLDDRGNIFVKKGGDVESHNHAPNPEEVQALVLLTSMKRHASEHPEEPPSRIMRRLQDAPEAVLAQLPERENIRKQIQRERLKDLPSNPTSIKDLKEIPHRFQITKNGEKFLLYDSYEDDNYTLDGRIIMFSSTQNLRQLFRSETWYVDGTFSVVPTLFFQLFAVMGSVSVQGETTIALPLVYALMEDKNQSSYSKVIEEIISKAEQAGIRIQRPSSVMTDFELAIINGVKNHLGNNIKLCLFHLCQSVYRRVQAEGLQADYQNADDSSIRDASKMMCALSFVPVDDVMEVFDLFANQAPEIFANVVDYFEVTYIRGRAARGRRRAVPVRYAPALWNHYNSVLEGKSRTNNASEGWHNRLQLVMGKKHPSLYAFIIEVQREQGDTETMLRQISLGQRVRRMPSSHYQAVDRRIFNMVANYEVHREDGTVLEYLKNLSYHLHVYT